MPSDKVEKKRKRASNGHERPSKKPSLELQDLPPLAASVVNDDSELAPVISMLFMPAYSLGACGS
jgi:DNA-directed RNA polymerase I subunit RPA49